MPKSRPTILVLLGCFSKGVEATGPNQSMAGIAERLSDRFRFRVIAEAREGDEPGRWTKLMGVEQLPLVPSFPAARGLRGAICATPHDLLIANSLFDRVFTIPMLALRSVALIPRRPVLLAPRGEFSPGGLQFSRRRKAAFLATAKLTGLLRGVAYQATSEGEADDIRRTIGPDARTFIAPNIRGVAPLPPHRPRNIGKPVRVAFLSRIDRKKNLEFALDVLAAAGVPVEFNIYGPVSNQAYWRACQMKISRLPEQVSVFVHGAIPQHEVLSTLAQQDLFFLPTMGENFGHAIADALTAGTPALLSDLTPWRGLTERRAGWDLPLHDIQAFVTAVREVASLAPARIGEMRAAARQFAEEELDPQKATDALELCIHELINHTVKRSSVRRQEIGSSGASG
jgi:glycosyltransferase involved in cell wall biosynthesis